MFWFAIPTPTLLREYNLIWSFYFFNFAVRGPLLDCRSFPVKVETIIIVFGQNYFLFRKKSKSLITAYCIHIQVHVFKFSFREKFEDHFSRIEKVTVVISVQNNFWYLILKVKTSPCIFSVDQIKSFFTSNIL